VTSSDHVASEVASWKAKKELNLPPLPPPGPIHPPKNPDSLEDCDRVLTPACIRALYKFEALDPSEPVSIANAMGIFEEEDLCK
jgi:tripeptidyl-peptidase-1